MIHTPGPWGRDADDIGTAAYGKIAHLFAGENIEADASLIAAAPERQRYRATVIHPDCGQQGRIGK